ncbi:hypothetical protein LOAG_02974 [Loa loa]|uniref:Uncharacterized protein n=1 Tax=Loa loa TaxID=7209 RepID=A0A1S0U7A6_LOALO|nr:hypothetical protein LOAG_02974 [Loa loa]EFO25509.1 hypothetical protein LOAG_02974 [Loa loa]
MAGFGILRISFIPYQILEEKGGIQKDVFDAQKQPQLDGLPPGGADTTLSTDVTSSLSLIKAKFLNHLTRKIYQHTVSLLYRDTFEAHVMDSISKIAAKNGAVAPM